MKKKELEARVKELEIRLSEARNKVPKYNFSNNHIDMTKIDETKIVIARAVEAGMIVLQGLQCRDQKIYGVDVDFPNNNDLRPEKFGAIGD